MLKDMVYILILKDKNGDISSIGHVYDSYWLAVAKGNDLMEQYPTIESYKIIQREFVKEKKE